MEKCWKIPPCGKLYAMFTIRGNCSGEGKNFFSREKSRTSTSEYPFSRTLIPFQEKRSINTKKAAFRRHSSTATLVADRRHQASQHCRHRKKRRQAFHKPRKRRHPPLPWSPTGDTKPAKPVGGDIAPLSGSFSEAAARAWAHALNRADVRQKGSREQARSSPLSQQRHAGRSLRAKRGRWIRE